jgi:hypothetical protein
MKYFVKHLTEKKRKSGQICQIKLTTCEKLFIVLNVGLLLQIYNTRCILYVLLKFGKIQIGNVQLHLINKYLNIQHKNVNC